MPGLPAAATSVGNQSRPEKIPFSTVPSFTCPGQRIIAGTRNPPSQDVPLPPLNGVMPPSGQVYTSAPVVGGKDDDGVVSLANILKVLQERADAAVQLRHAGFFQAGVVRGIHHRLILRWDVGEDVHAGGVVPDEERLAIFLGLVHKAVRMLDQYLVEGLHIVLG